MASIFFELFFQITIGLWGAGTIDRMLSPTAFFRLYWLRPILYRIIGLILCHLMEGRQTPLSNSKSLKSRKTWSTSSWKWFLILKFSSGIKKLQIDPCVSKFSSLYLHLFVSAAEIYNRFSRCPLHSIASLQVQNPRTYLDNRSILSYMQMKHRTDKQNRRHRSLRWMKIPWFNSMHSAIDFFPTSNACYQVRIWINPVGLNIIDYLIEFNKYLLNKMLKLIFAWESITG